MNPRNGRAPFGLVQAVRAQERYSESVEMERRFDAAWATADHELTTTAH
jgi:hypothetical protein